jgi:Leucine-rich repeat (LRR) protein
LAIVSTSIITNFLLGGFGSLIRVIFESKYNKFIKLKPFSLKSTYKTLESFLLSRCNHSENNVKEKYLSYLQRWGSNFSKLYDFDSEPQMKKIRNEFLQKFQTFRKKIRKTLTFKEWETNLNQFLIPELKDFFTPVNQFTLNESSSSTVLHSDQIDDEKIVDEILTILKEGEFLLQSHERIQVHSYFLLQEIKDLLNKQSTSQVNIENNLAIVSPQIEELFSLVKTQYSDQQEYQQKWQKDLVSILQDTFSSRKDINALHQWLSLKMEPMSKVENLDNTVKSIEYKVSQEKIRNKYQYERLNASNDKIINLLNNFLSQRENSVNSDQIDLNKIIENLFRYRKHENPFLMENEDKDFKNKFVNPPLITYRTTQDITTLEEKDNISKEENSIPGLDVISSTIENVENKKINLLIIVGEMGSGKSTLLERTEYEAWVHLINSKANFLEKIEKNAEISYSEKVSNGSYGGRIPLFFRCKDLVHKCSFQSDNEFLLSLSNVYTKIQGDIHISKELIKMGQLLFIFDGLDEIPKTIQQKLYSSIHDLAKWENNKVILSVRESLLSKIVLKDLTIPSPNIQQVKKWSEPEILALIHQDLELRSNKIKNSGNKPEAQEIWSTWQDNHYLKELCTNAFLLDTMLDLLDEVQLRINKEKSISREWVFNTLINKRLKQNFNRENSLFNTQPALLEFREYAPIFFRHCCWHLALNFMNDNQSFSSINEIQTLAPIDREIRDVISNIGQGPILFRNELSENGLFTSVILSGNGRRFNFRHKSLAEFLVADATKEWLTHRVSKNYWNNDYIPFAAQYFSREALEFLIGLLGIQLDSKEISLEQSITMEDFYQFLQEDCKKGVFRQILLWIDKIHNVSNKSQNNDQTFLFCMQKLLKHQTVLNLSCYRGDIREKRNFGKFKSLDFPLFRRCTTIEILSEIFEFNKTFKVILLEGNDLHTLPENIVSLDNLEKLGLGNNRLSSLPENFGKLKSLKHLGFRNNQLNFLPDDIGSLKGLENLWADNNQIDAIPESICTLTSLKELSLNWNMITNLPNGLGSLSSLEKLSLRYNQIENLPDIFNELTSLKYISIRKNRITSIPNSIGSLVNLEKLNLNENKLKIIPKFIENLTALKSLRLEKNQITTLPEIFVKFINLTELNLSDNQLTTLPNTIGRLIALKDLKLRNNGLKTIPEAMINLHTLKALSIGKNMISNLPEMLGNLTSLESLSFDNNLLTTLPENFGKLKKLIILNLNENQLTNLPQSFGNLSDLKILNLNKNKLNTLPDSFRNLNSLNTLRLDENLFETLPDIFGNLCLLRNLNLCNNKIFSLPRSIFNLINLKDLNLKNNKLRTLPEEIIFLKSLTWLNLGENKLLSLPNSLVDLNELTEIDLSLNPQLIISEKNEKDIRKLIDRGCDILK